MALVIVSVQLATQVSDASYFLTQLTMTGYYLLVITGLCLLMGYAGQISIGHAGFFAIGGYTSAFLTTHDLSPHAGHGAVKALAAMGLLAERTGLYGEPVLHVNAWAACLVAVALTVGVAWLIGGPVLKLKGHYLAMATLGFGVIVHSILLGSPYLGAADGISDVPGFGLVPGLVVSGDMATRVQNYYVAWGLVLAGVAMLLNLVDSRVGRALRAVHGAEDAASAMGVDTAAFKLRMFVVSAAYAAVAGVFLTHYNGGIGPSEASVMKSVRYVAIVAVGGMANLWGAVIMGAALNFLSLRGYFGSLDDAVFGAVLVVIMLFAPDGLLKRELIAMVPGLGWLASRDEPAPEEEENPAS